MAERVALITGGAKGIGRGIALDLAAQQWSVAICYRTSEVEARATADAITSRGGRALSIRCDVSDPQAARGLAAQVEQQWGRIDALINGAGPYHRVNLFDETVEGWNEMFDGNLHPIFYLAKAVSTGMKARKSGRIISFSMANADQGVAQPQITAHYIAKSGILILSRTLARLLAPHNITVNVISPGFVSSGSAPEEELQKMLKNIPAGYIGQVDDAVSVVKFLLSDEARYVNGANVHLSGGWGL
jgi:3-oxoacyl-[acyl-carrier protein] reductase